MKNKVLFIVLTVVLVLSVVGNVFAYAYSSRDAQPQNSEENVKDNTTVVDAEAEAVNIGETFVRKNIDKQKNITIDGKTKQIVYENSEKIRESRVFDVYSDSEGEYKFSKDGVLISRNDYKSKRKDVTKAMAGKSEKISEQEAIRLAYDFVTVNIDDYKLVECSYNDSLATYSLVYAKVYNGFIDSEKVFIKITALGVPISWNCVGYGEYTDFDVDILDNVSKEKIEEYAKKQLDVIYGEKMTEYNVGNFYLEKINGEYVISFTASVKWLNADNVELATARTMYYEI